MKTIKYFLILSMFLLPNFFTENIFGQDFKPIEQIYLSKNAKTGEVDIAETVININKTINKINIIIANMETQDNELPNKIKTLETEIDTLKSSFSNNNKSVAGDINVIEDQIDTIKNQIADISNQINDTNNLDRLDEVVKGLQTHVGNLINNSTNNTVTISTIQNDITTLNSEFTNFKNTFGTGNSVPWSIITGKPDYLTTESKLINKIQTTADLNNFSKKLKLQNINVSANDFFNNNAIKVAQNIVNTYLLNARLTGPAAYNAFYVNRENGDDLNALYYAAINPVSSLRARRNNPFKTLDVALRVSYAQGNHAVIYITDTGRGMHHIRKSTFHALSGAGLHLISESASAQFILIDYDKQAVKGKADLYSNKYATEYNNAKAKGEDFYYYWGQYGSYLHIEGKGNGKVILGIAGTESLSDKERLTKVPTKYYDYIHPKLSTHLKIAYHGVGVYTKNAEIWGQVIFAHNATYSKGDKTKDLIWMENTTLKSDGAIGTGKKFQYYMNAKSYNSKTDKAEVEYLTWSSNSLFPTYHVATNVTIGTIYSIPQKK